MPGDWWLKKPQYFLFIIREGTCIFVGAYAVYLLILAATRNDPNVFSVILHSPVLIALQIIALPMLLFHTITWINLTPKVMVVWRGEERIAPALIAVAHYAMWLVGSAVILWLVLLTG